MDESYTNGGLSLFLRGQDYWDRRKEEAKELKHPPHIIEGLPLAKGLESFKWYSYHPLLTNLYALLKDQKTKQCQSIVFGGMSPCMAKAEVYNINQQLL